MINIGPETEQIEYKKSIGELKTVLVCFEGSRCPYLAYHVPRIRVSDEDLVMDQDTYDDMIRKRESIDYSWEKKVSRYRTDDVGKEAFSEYLRKAKEAGRIDFEDTDVEIVLDKLELTDGKRLLNAGAALFCDCGIINELQIAKFASDERLTFTDMRRYSGSIMELKKKGGAIYHRCHGLAC